MKNLSTTEMTEYLKNVAGLECMIYRQKEIVSVSKNETRERRYIPDRFVWAPREPEKEYKIKEKPVFKYTLKDVLLKLDRNYVITFFSFLAISFVSILLYVFFDLLFFEYYAILMALATIYPLVVLVINSKRLYKTKKNDYKYNLEKYNESVLKNEEYKKTYSSRMKQYQEDLIKFNNGKREYEREKQASLENYQLAKKTVEQMEKTQKDLENTLETLYNFDVIYPKYRNMIAVCAIYEYFVSGRCSELTGPDGAYNLYESELRQNLIIDKLNTIISQLESIKNNQFMLYNEMVKTNRVMNEISSDIKKVVQSTQRIESIGTVIAQQNAMIAKNTEAIKYIALING